MFCFKVKMLQKFKQKMIKALNQGRNGEEQTYFRSRELA